MSRSFLRTRGARAAAVTFLAFAKMGGLHATTWNVDSTSPNTDLNFCTAAPADCSFPGAVSRLAGTGDSIVFTVSTSLADEVHITKDVSIDAAGASLPRVAVYTTVGWATVSIRNAVWQNINSVSDYGAALYVGARQIVTIEDSQFLYNRTSSNGQAGGIFNFGNLTVTRTRFEGNYSPQSAGAIRNESGPVEFPSRLSVSDSVFRLNGVLDPGGPFPQRGQFGAIKTDAPALIRNCLFHDNDSNYASAIQSSASLHIYNSTFWNNITRHSTESGALLLGGPTRIANSTIVGNHGVTSGGLFVYPGTDVQVVNTLIADNTGTSPEISGRIYSVGNNLIRNPFGAVIDGDVNRNVYGLDPRLSALANNGGNTSTLALQADSPALNAGFECVLTAGGCGDFPTVALTTDQRGSGFSRAHGAGVDIGAFELTQPDMVITDANSGIGSLRQVLADTATGGTVVFSPSYFSQPRTIFLASALVINRTLTIQGPGAALATLDSNNLDRVLKVDAPATLTLSGVRLTRGNPGASNSGGGVLVNGGVLSATDVVIDNSRGNQGGCIYNNGSLTLIRARLTACQASFGAGLLNEGGKTANVYDSVIENNVSSGGAGGVGNNGSLLLERVTLAGNSATFGGGMINATTATLYNVTLSGNTATTNKAGGIYIGVGSSMTVNHATITANTALAFAGGGIWNDGGGIDLRNSIIAGNFGAGANVDAVGSISGRGYNLIGSSGGYSFNGGSDLSGNQVNVPARLGPLAINASFGGTHAPLWDSPVIDAGGNALSVDARGLLRPVDFTHIANASGGNGSDIGAYEVQIVTPTAVVASVGAAIGSGAVSVAFSAVANGGPTATSYTAICGARSAAGSASPLVVTGLPIGSAVTCTVTADNASVSGIASAPSNGVVPLAVPGAPTITSATAGNANVSVAFNAPASDGGSPITGYTASCGAQSNSASSSPIVVVGLVNGTPVTCTVIATNTMGNSAPSAASSSVIPSTVPDPPTAVLATAGDTVVNVLLTPPLDNGGSAITGYTATCGARSNSGSAAPIVVSGLTNDVAVTCTVVATNARGNSAASLPSSTVTPGLAPGAPGIGTAVAGNGQVSVVFTPPASDGGSPITGYTAACGARTASAAGSPISVIGLINGVPMTCTVTATNAVGNGPASALSNSATPGLPGSFAYIPMLSPPLVAVVNLDTGVVVQVIGLPSGNHGVAVSPDGARVYLVAYAGVSVVDTLARAHVATIPVGNSPRNAVVSPDSTRIYVTNAGSNDVSVIDAATNQVVALIPVSEEPQGIAITPDGSRMFVACPGGSAVSVIDTASNQVIDTLTLGLQPRQVAISPDGRHAYVTGYSSNDLTVIEVASGAVVGTVAVGNDANGVIVGRDSRRVYVSNFADYSVSVIDADTRTVVATVPVGVGPEGIDVSADGSEVHVVNHGSRSISRISTTTNTVVGTVDLMITPAAMGRFVSMGGRAPEFTSGAAPNGLYGVPYSHTLTVSGAPASSLALVSGQLPQGLTLNGAVISGTPTTVGAAVNAVVRASNGVGAAATQAISIVIAATVPDAPTINGISAGDGSVTVSFDPPQNNGGTPITWYNAFCGGFAASSPNSPITVNSQTNGVPVTCRVGAVNAVGAGVASAPSAPVTPGVAAAFTSAALPGGTFGTPYQQVLTASGSPAPTFALPSGSLPTGLSLDATSGVISGTPSSVGSFNGSLSASNGVGSPAAQAFAIVIAAGLPGAPIAVVATRGNAEVSVAFVAPAIDGGSVISGYTASCGAQSQSGSASPIVVNGLTNGTAVICTVIATNAVGDSVASAPSASVTPATLPNAPGMFEATAGNGTATLRFAPPASDGGATVEDYTATCLPGGASVTGSASPLTVTGLANGTLYGCVVFARNAVGSGPDSAPSSVIPAAVSSADVSVTMSNGTRFVNGGASTTYVITVSNPGSAGVARVRVQDALDPDFSAPSWTCSGQGGAVCAASGIGGPLDERVDLPLGSSVTILLTATVAALPETPVSNLVSVTLPASFDDPDLQNNIATDGPDIRGLFRDGLE